MPQVPYLQRDDRQGRQVQTVQTNERCQVTLILQEGIRSACYVIPPLNKQSALHRGFLSMSYRDLNIAVSVDGFSTMRCSTDIYFGTFLYYACLYIHIQRECM
jgi:hypothetical protein